jgi:arylsulfatase A-like enzyme
MMPIVHIERNGSRVWPGRFLYALLSALLAACSPGAAPNRHLLIVVDGLRPDYVTAEAMPHLWAIGRRGVVFNRHHAVYPTVTRVNASSISTGAYPERHGLLGNSVFFPELDPARFLNTSDLGILKKITEGEGRLLTTGTMGESLQAAGRKMLVVSSGSIGSAFLNNHTVAGGAILHPRYALPDTLAADMKMLGAPPPGESPALGDRYAVDAFLKVGLPRVDPSVTVMWLGGLDSVTHGHGIGARATIEILGQVDEEIGRIQDALRTSRLFDRYNLWITSDHGFSTATGRADVGAVLQPFLRPLSDGSPRIVASDGAVYVRDGDEAAVSGIVNALQRTPGVGAIFTRAARPGSFDGSEPGTLSFDAVRWNHERSPQILFSPDWTDAMNDRGRRGASASGGVAGHGSSSPWDIHNTLIAAGPDLRRGITVDAPSGNVDFAPTFLGLLGIAIPPAMQGRRLEEALIDGDAARANAARTMVHTASTPDGAYAATGTFSIVRSGGREYRYFDGAKATRRSPLPTLEEQRLRVR